MLELAIGLVVVALVAGSLGFTGVARGAANLAKIAFFVFLGIAAVVLHLGFLGVAAIS